MEYAIIFLPLIGSIFGYLGRSINKFFSEVFTSILVSISAVLSIVVFWNGIQNNNYGNYQIVEWISSGDFIANWSNFELQITPVYNLNSFFSLSTSALESVNPIPFRGIPCHKLINFLLLKSIESK